MDIVFNLVDIFLEDVMKNQLLLSVVGLFMTTNAIADDQQDIRCMLGGSTIAGMVVHIDPATGRPTSHPLPEQAAEIASLQVDKANRSTEGLVEEVGPTGGVRVNLRNRFRSPLVAVVQPDSGVVRTDHISCKPATDLPISGDN